MRIKAHNAETEKQLSTEELEATGKKPRLKYPPWHYGIAWWGPGDWAVAYPFPLNWIIALARKVWLMVRDVPESWQRW
jgi:hypothetical protein